MAAKVVGVVPNSIAEDLQIEPGDILKAINSVAPKDLIDYDYQAANENIELFIVKKDGTEWFFDIEKDPDEDLGLIFAAAVFDDIYECNNHCIFCFVNQLPKKARPSLHVKDDDYRMSFLQGNYITGTNLSEADIDRICRLMLSPLYISVHSTCDALRRKLLGNIQAPPILPLLKRLKGAGLTIHSQVVLCPGFNDGENLKKTLADLATFWPQVASVALVPVGLTAYQNKNLQPYNKTLAKELLRETRKWQKACKKTLGSRFVFAADEFYLLAGEPLPVASHYEGYSQIENGIGLVRKFYEGWHKKKANLPTRLSTPKKITIATGESGAQALSPAVAVLNKIENLTVEMVPIHNQFFGGHVTVTGLLTGRCLLAGLKEWRREQKEEQPSLLLSSIMLKYNEDVFLDDMTVTELALVLKVNICLLEPSGEALIDFISKL